MSTREVTANLLPLGPTSNDPLGSALVVATGPIRAQYGGRLVSVYAPALIARFGSGNARIDIRLVFPGGAATYSAVQKTALRARKAAASGETDANISSSSFRRRRGSAARDAEIFFVITCPVETHR